MSEEEGATPGSSPFLFSLPPFPFSLPSLSPFPFSLPSLPPFLPFPPSFIPLSLFLLFSLSLSQYLRDVDPSLHKDEILQDACRRGRLEGVEEILNQGGFNINSTDDLGNTPLINAFFSLSPLSSIMFQVPKALPASYLFVFLFFSKRTLYGHFDVVSALVNVQGIKIDAQNRLAFWYWVNLLCFFFLLLLLLFLLFLFLLFYFFEKELTCSRQWDTALHIASSKEHEDIVRLLIEKGAKISLKNKLKQTPHSATNSQEIKVFSPSFLLPFFFFFFFFFFFPPHFFFFFFFKRPLNRKYWKWLSWHPKLMMMWPLMTTMKGREKKKGMIEEPHFEFKKRRRKKEQKSIVWNTKAKALPTFSIKQIVFLSFHMHTSRQH